MVLQRAPQLIRPTLERLDAWFTRRFPLSRGAEVRKTSADLIMACCRRPRRLRPALRGIRAGALLTTIAAAQWRDIGVGLLATLGRVLPP